MTFHKNRKLANKTHHISEYSMASSVICFHEILYPCGIYVGTADFTSVSIYQNYVESLQEGRIGATRDIMVSELG